MSILKVRMVILALIHLGLCLTGQAQILVSGVVLDEQTKEPLPFLNIVIEKYKKGVQTNDKGEFNIKVESLDETLTFSFLGFQKKKLKAEPTMTVFLTPDALALSEVVVRFRNPAEEIIKKAVENKSQNNPDKYPSYSYKSYNKSILTANSITDVSSTKTTKKRQKLNKRLEDSEFFVNETVVKKKYLFPSQSQEIIEASRTSGSESSTILGTMSLLLQPFSFYNDLITFRGRRIQEIMEFVNPISPNSHKLYDFTLIDTLIVDRDSSFVIEFEPKKNANIEGLKGEIIINADGYAIEEVMAEPAAKNLLMSVKISQVYERFEGKWFPKTTQTEWKLPEFKVGDLELVLKIESHIEDISFNNRFSYADFSEKEVRIADDATYKSDDFWEQNRAENLTQREANTYEYFKNLSRFRKFLSTASLNISEWATSGVVPLGKNLDLSAQNLFDSNLYEGFRPTINLITSPNFSKIIRLDGKIAYGFGDKTWKYEGRAKLNLGKNNQTQLTFHYRNDISEPGNVQYFIWNNPQIPYELIRTFLISRADHLEQYKVEFNSRIAKNGKLNIAFIDEVRTPNYEYCFVKNDTELMSDEKGLHATILSMGYRMAIGEKFSQVGRGSIITEVPKLVFLLNYEQGIMGFMTGQFQFSKINTKLEYIHKSTRLGNTFVNLTAGKAFGVLPYTYLYNGRGSKIGNWTPIIWAANHFNTMGLYEFASDQYANLFLTHNFKELLFKTNVSWSKPDVSIVQGIAIGSLKNKISHQGIDFNTLEKVFFESGVTVDNIVRVKMKKLAYFGVGGGVFYRWGAYQLPKLNENLTYRLVWNVGF
ncbi:hypothetical protein GVN20_29330 [Runella sp. CRIBMP]|uniref:DUF5686 and carboxypeptidase-like regulatory domain-containing protein n=1 Tax=Runella sp. CRIBMP TaxID=2683261 RepID=UPI00141272F7|nr:DUF5686 and carboxypeptidase-like regulatory domain-containing protein [Runella sp. CRIBMP]NBB23483.1 hypothetical protein [Runella sp. CRIBMP]